MNFTDFLRAYDEFCLQNDEKSIHEVMSKLSEEEIINVYFYGCSTGCASDFIYYHQTEQIFKEYFEPVLDNVNELIREYGINFFDNFEFNYNNLVWLYVESVVDSFIYFCEDKGYIEEND